MIVLCCDRAYCLSMQCDGGGRQTALLKNGFVKSMLQIWTRA